MSTTNFRRLFMSGAVGLFLFISPTSPLGSPLLLSRQAGPAALTHAKATVVNHGGSVRHLFPPDKVIADLPAGADLERFAAELGEDWAIKMEPLVSPAVPAEYAWNRLVAPPSSEERAKHTGTPLSGDWLLPPAPDAGKAPGSISYGPYGAGFWDGSEYLIGSVGVAVVLVESDGSIDPSTEDWTGAERSHVAAHVVEATDWWASSTSLTPISFTYEFHYDVPVPYEPITHPQSEEGLWISAALGELGFSGSDRFTESQNLANDLKSRLGTDWAFVLYVVDSSVDGDGMFSSGHFAYAYLGGPFLVLTLDNDGWGQQNFSSVCAHEIGHIFYALDEYYGAASLCTEESGYLRYANQNSQYGTCLEDVDFCIMRSVPLGVATVCSSTRGQVGWVDADADLVPDVIDTGPMVQIDAVGKNGSTLVEGTASVSPVTNSNPRGWGNDISINQVFKVEYRLDGGSWAVALPTDGTWDNGTEAFYFSPVADSGTHMLQLRAQNTPGNYTANLLTAEIEMTGATGVTLHGEDEAPAAVRLIGNWPNPFNPTTTIRFLLGEAGDGHAVVYNVSGGTVRTLHDGALPAGESALEWDGRNDSGVPVRSGRYLYQIRAHGETASGTMLLVR